MKKQLSKVYRLADSTAANEIEPVIYADFSVTPTDIELNETRYAVIIRGIEIDITSDVRYELNKIQNRRKREQWLDMIVNELSNDEVTELFNEEKIQLENHD